MCDLLRNLSTVLKSKWLQEVFLFFCFLILLKRSYSYRRQRLRKVALSSSQASSLLGYDLREAHLSVLLGGGGGGGYRLNGINSSGASVLVNDSLLSTLVLNFASPEPEEASKAFASSVDDFLKKSAPASQSWKSR